VESSEVSRAIAAATSTAVVLDPLAGDAIVLHNSNKLALRPMPADGLVRVVA
jgi:hypothetical protein